MSSQTKTIYPSKRVGGANGVSIYTISQEVELYRGARRRPGFKTYTISCHRWHHRYGRMTIVKSFNNKPTRLDYKAPRNWVMI